MALKLDPQHVFHYGMMVPDMDEALGNWKKIGAQVLMPPCEAEGVGVLCCVILYNHTVLELVAPSNAEAMERLKPQMLRPGAIDHVAYFSNNIEADLKALEKTGGQVVIPKTFNTGFDRNMAFIAMPTGFVIELMERKATGKIAEDPLKTYNEVMAAAYVS